MERKRLLGLGVLALGTTLAASACNAMEQDISGFEYKISLNKNGALVDCYTNTDPNAIKEKGHVTVIFNQALCLDKTPGAKAMMRIPDGLFSGEIIVDSFGGLPQEPLMVTPRAE